MRCHLLIIHYTALFMQCTVLLMHCTVVPSAKNCNFHRWSWIVSNSVTLKACFFPLCLVSLFLVPVPLGRNSQQNSENNRAGIELKTSSPANHSAIPISLHKSHLRKVPAARDMNWGPGSWRPNKSRSYLPSERCRRQLGHRASKKTRLN